MAIQKRVTDVIAQGVSIQARDANNDNKLVGIRTAYIVDQ